MSVLKDMTCVDCGAVHEEMIDADCVAAPFDCPRCGKETPHVSRCTGGVRLRPFVTPISYEHRDWSGDVRCLGVTAEYADGTPVTEKDGRFTDAEFRAGDRSEERRERKRWERKRAEGRAPLRFS